MVAVHTASLVFDAPRGEWNKVTSRVRISDEATQKYACALVNTVVLVIYVLDIAVQCTFVRLKWRDVDWAGEFVKTGNRNVSRFRSTLSKRNESIRSAAMSNRSRRLGPLQRLWQDIRLGLEENEWNVVFLGNLVVVLVMVLATIADIPSKAAFLRPIMLLFVNYRLQTAAGAIFKALSYLGDMLIIMSLFLIVYAATTSVTVGSDDNAPYPEQGFNSFWNALLSYYVLLSTENFPQIIERFGNEDFVGLFFISFLVLGYFMLMAYMTAIVFDGYYHVKIAISLKEYLTERSALAAAFLCLSYDPLASEFNEVLTLGDLLEANLKFHGKEAGFSRINELFLELDRDGNAALDEEEFYRFCDAVVVQTENDLMRLLV